MEEWVNIVDFPNYDISNLGRVRNNVTGYLKKLYKKDNGYYSTMLQNGSIKKFAAIHRLVALAFIKNEFNKEEVNHIDGDKSNNQIFNLEWATRSENILHSIHILKRHKPYLNLKDNNEKTKLPVIGVHKNGLGSISFNSLTAAAKHLNSTIPEIWISINKLNRSGKRKSVKKYVFDYVKPNS